MEVGTGTQRDDRQTQRSLLLGIVVWFAHLNIVYGLGSLGCQASWLSFSVGPMSGLQLAEALLTLITAGALLVLTYQAWRNWRAFQTEKPPENPRLLSDTEKDRRPFLAFIAMSANGFFLLFVIAFFVPLFGLPICAQG